MVSILIENKSHKHLKVKLNIWLSWPARRLNQKISGQHWRERGRMFRPRSYLFHIVMYYVSQLFTIVIILSLPE